MTIDQAIERLQQRVEGEFFIDDPKNVDDMKLGIQALKRYRALRDAGASGTSALLPGETRS